MKPEAHANTDPWGRRKRRAGGQKLKNGKGARVVGKKLTKEKSEPGRGGSKTNTEK